VRDPIVRDGAVWFVTEGRIQALDLASGGVRWGHVQPGTTFGDLGGVDDAAVYARVVCSGDECGAPRWHAVDRGTRKTIWSAPAVGDVPPALGEGKVALAEGPRLVMREANGGAVAWTRTFAHEVRAIAIDGGTVWVVDEDAHAVFALAVADGQERARFQVDDARGLGRRSWGVFPGAAASGGRLYAVVGQEVVAFSPDARAPVWRRPGYGVATSADAVVIAGGEGRLSCFDTTGRPRWSITLDAWGQGVVGDGLIAIRTSDDFVDVLDLHTGAHLVHYDLDEGRSVPRE
jgi:outer membrane protein assembly factor BamB